MTHSFPEISIVVPVYNSSHTIVEFVLRTQQAMARGNLSYEIILADDCSTDNSWKVIKQVCKQNPHTKGYRLMQNSGQWRSSLAGISKAKGRYIVTIDDDLEYNPEDILQLYKHISKNNYQLVFGIAAHKYIMQNKNAVLSNLRNKMVNRLWKKPVTDSFKIFKRGLVFEKNDFLPKAPFEVFATQNTDTKLWGYTEVSFNRRFAGHSNYALLKKAGLFMTFSAHFTTNAFNYFMLCILLLLSVILSILLCIYNGLPKVILTGLIVLSIPVFTACLYYLQLLIIKRKKNALYSIAEESD